MGGSFTEDEFLFLVQKFPQLGSLQIFIECGTYKGESSRVMSKYFSDVYTFEINGKLFYDSQLESLDKKLRNIHHYFGNSYELMNKVVAMDDRTCMFFLDAHQSGSDTSNNGEELVPLYKELQTINNNYKKQFGVVCIDDYRLWNNQPVPDDWKHIDNKKILDSLSNFTITNCFEYNDRMYIFIQ